MHFIEHDRMSTDFSLSQTGRSLLNEIKSKKYNSMTTVRAELQSHNLCKVSTMYKGISSLWKKSHFFKERHIVSYKCHNYRQSYCEWGTKWQELKKVLVTELFFLAYSTGLTWAMILPSQRGTTSLSSVISSWMTFISSSSHSVLKKYLKIMMK